MELSEVLLARLFFILVTLVTTELITYIKRNQCAADFCICENLIAKNGNDMKVFRGRLKRFSLCILVGCLLDYFNFGFLSALVVNEMLGNSVDFQPLSAIFGFITYGHLERSSWRNIGMNIWVNLILVANIIYNRDRWEYILSVSIFRILTALSTVTFFRFQELFWELLYVSVWQVILEFPLKHFLNSHHMFRIPELWIGINGTVYKMSLINIIYPGFIIANVEYIQTLRFPGAKYLAMMLYLFSSLTHFYLYHRLNIKVPQLIIVVPIMISGLYMARLFDRRAKVDKKL